MKKIILALFVITGFLTQISFAISPALDAFNQQQGAESGAFWAQQAKERDDFGKQHADALANHDKHFKATHDLDMARRSGKSTVGLENPPADDPAFSAFVAKQQSDKEAFFAKLNQEREAFLSANPGIN